MLLQSSYEYMSSLLEVHIQIESVNHEFPRMYSAIQSISPSYSNSKNKCFCWHANGVICKKQSQMAVSIQH